MKQKINFSLVQTDLIWENTIANLHKFDKLLQNVPEESEIVILPEMFSTGFTMNIQNLEKPAGKKAFEWLLQKAISLQKNLTGSILYEENNRFYNRMFWIKPDGNYEYYNKRHLFHQGGEDKVMTAGKQKTIVTFKKVRFLLQICYDLRFPVWSKNNYNKQTDAYDYDAIIYIANWPESRKQAYLNLLKARAIENQAVVLWVNRIGKDNHKMNHSGDSRIIDASGNIVAKTQENKEEILNFEVDFSKVYQLRNNFKVGLDWDKFEIF